MTRTGSSTPGLAGDLAMPGWSVGRRGLCQPRAEAREQAGHGEHTESPRTARRRRFIMHVCSTVPAETEPHAAPDDRRGRRCSLMLIPVCALLIELARGLLSARRWPAAPWPEHPAGRAAEGTPDARCELHRTARAARARAPVPAAGRSGVRSLPPGRGGGPLSKPGHAVPRRNKASALSLR